MRRTRLVKAVIKQSLKQLHLFDLLNQPINRLREWKRIPKDKQLIEQYLTTAGVRKHQIGCGSHRLEGWLNSDLKLRAGDIIHLDATAPFPFDDCAFDYVFSEHIIEHVTYSEGLDMLSECYRTLKPEGKIRVATPDLLFLIQLYQPAKSELQQDYIHWAVDVFIKSATAYEDTFVINNFVRDWGHMFIYDEKVLRAALEGVGFVDVVRCALNQSEDTELSGLENEGRMPSGFLALETMVFEARKTGHGEQEP